MKMKTWPARRVPGSVLAAAAVGALGAAAASAAVQTAHWLKQGARRLGLV